MSEDDGGGPWRDSPPQQPAGGAGGDSATNSAPRSPGGSMLDVAAYEELRRRREEKIAEMLALLQEERLKHKKPRRGPRRLPSVRQGAGPPRPPTPKEEPDSSQQQADDAFVYRPSVDPAGSTAARSRGDPVPSADASPARTPAPPSERRSPFSTSLSPPPRRQIAEADGERSSTITLAMKLELAMAGALAPSGSPRQVALAASVESGGPDGSQVSVGCDGSDAAAIDCPAVERLSPRGSSVLPPIINGDRNTALSGTGSGIAVSNGNLSGTLARVVSFGGSLTIPQLPPLPVAPSGHAADDEGSVAHRVGSSGSIVLASRSRSDRWAPHTPEDTAAATGDAARRRLSTSRSGSLRLPRIGSHHRSAPSRDPAGATAQSARRSSEAGASDGGRRRSSKAGNAGGDGEQRRSPARVDATRDAVSEKVARVLSFCRRNKESAGPLWRPSVDATTALATANGSGDDSTGAGGADGAANGKTAEKNGKRRRKRRGPSRVRRGEDAPAIEDAGAPLAPLDGGSANEAPTRHSNSPRDAKPRRGGNSASAAPPAAPVAEAAPTTGRGGGGSVPHPPRDPPTRQPANQSPKAKSGATRERVRHTKRTASVGSDPIEGYGVIERRIALGERDATHSAASRTPVVGACETSPRASLSAAASPSDRHNIVGSSGVHGQDFDADEGDTSATLAVSTPEVGATGGGAAAGTLLTATTLSAAQELLLETSRDAGRRRGGGGSPSIDDWLETSQLQMTRKAHLRDEGGSNGPIVEDGRGSVGAGEEVENGEATAPDGTGLSNVLIGLLAAAAHNSASVSPSLRGRGAASHSQSQPPKRFRNRQAANSMRGTRRGLEGGSSLALRSAGTGSVEALLTRYVSADHGALLLSMRQGSAIAAASAGEGAIAQPNPAANAALYRKMLGCGGGFFGPCDM